MRSKYAVMFYLYMDTFRLQAVTLVIYIPSDQLLLRCQNISAQPAGVMGSPSRLSFVK